MNDTMTHYLEGIQEPKIRRHLEFLLRPVLDRMSTQSHTSGALAIHGAGSPVVKTGATWVGIASGVPLSIAAADMPALVGTITANKFNVYCFFADSAGTVTSAMGTEGATLAAVKFPAFPEGKALIGYVTVTHTSNFVGGTTNLDTAGVTATYVNPLGPFDPSVLL